MPENDDIISFWMNSDETKFVTVDNDSNLQLFYLPYIFKQEMPTMNFKNRLGFKITKIAFSHNEKLVIIASENILAVAKIESIEQFFNFDID